MKNIIPPIILIIFACFMINLMVEKNREADIRLCDRDALLFNRTTEMIDGSCYVLMDDGVYLPQMTYWFNHYINAE